MPPRIPRLAVGLAKNSPTSILPRNHQICPICSLAQASISSTRHRTSRLKRRELGIHVRKVTSQTKTTSGATDNTRAPPGGARNELREALLDLQKHAGSFVNISRLQLALRGLEQPTGQETIRIAILALADGGASLRKAKELLRLIAADPLKSEEEWERLLIQNQKTDRPLLLKIGHESSDEQGSRLVQQLNIASPMLNGHNLELLVLEMEPTPQMTNVPEVNFGNSVLVPTMEIPTSSSGRYTPVTTPVHRAIIVGNGIAGACTIMSLPVSVGDPDVASAAMDLEISNGENDSTLPFKIVDLPKGTTALSLFRESLDNAVAYEEKWFASGIPQIAEWIKLDSAPLEGVTKEPLKRLIYSLIENAYAQLETERSKRLAALLSDKVSSSDLKDLKLALGGWAERAHTELRDDLDIAFEGRRWRKLGWWKLFWRVDDVSMIASDILSQRFLTNAEKEIIFLSGRINQSGIAESIPEGKLGGENWAYKPVPKDFTEKLGSQAPDTQLKNILERPEDTEAAAIPQRPWPLQIPITRGYLSSETVPALQALSQKLVLQTLSTSFFSSAFGGLVYVSTLSAGLYEAGAVATLGIVWSLRRMQKRWETARSFWEGEVREEGRKAVRGVESEVGELLVPRDRPLEGAEDLEEAEKAIAKAETALQSAK